MLLLSLGPDLLAALMRNTCPGSDDAPDLSWLLFGPDDARLFTAQAEIGEQIQAAE